MISPMKSSIGRRASIAAVAIAMTGAAALVAGLSFTPAGCTSDCKTVCPMPYVYIGSADSVTQVPIAGIDPEGPACPPSTASSVSGRQACRRVHALHHHRSAARNLRRRHLLLRPSRPRSFTSSSARSEPAAPATRRSVTPDSSYPRHADAGITGQTTGADAITIVVDGGGSDAVDGAGSDASDAGASDGAAAD